VVKGDKGNTSSFLQSKKKKKRTRSESSEKKENEKKRRRRGLFSGGKHSMQLLKSALKLFLPEVVVARCTSTHLQKQSGWMLKRAAVRCHRPTEEGKETTGYKHITSSCFRPLLAHTHSLSSCVALLCSVSPCFWLDPATKQRSKRRSRQKTANKANLNVDTPLSPFFCTSSTPSKRCCWTTTKVSEQ